MSKLSEALDILEKYVSREETNGTTKTDWRPISTAKKDGRYLLVTWEDTWKTYPHIEVCAYTNGNWNYVFDGDVANEKPTHWMPLPNRP
jgi:hypothetical protein